MGGMCERHVYVGFPPACRWCRKLMPAPNVPAPSKAFIPFLYKEQSMKFFRFSGSVAEEAERISRDDLRAAFELAKQEGENGGLFQQVGDRWFKARVRQEDDGKGDGYELENWIPVKLDDVPESLKTLTETERSRQPRASEPSPQKPKRAEEEVMKGNLDPNSTPAKEAAERIAAPQSLQMRQGIAGAGQPAAGSSTPNAPSQDAIKLGEQLERGSTGQKEPAPKTEAAKPAAPSPVGAPSGAPKVAAPGVKSPVKEGEK